MQPLEQWDPNEWEDFVYGLLQDRHGALDVQPVPARHQGDLGLDYFTLSGRAAYQCYAVQEPTEVAQRARKQKTKITQDLQKLARNSSNLQKLFGTTKIRTWVLVVPLHDSIQVNLHVAAKTESMRALALPYLAPDFEVQIQDLRSFSSASRQSRFLQRKSIEVPRAPASDEQIQQWSMTSNVLTEALAEKLMNRLDEEEVDQLEGLVDESIRWFLERENLFELLKNDAPQLYEQIRGIVERRLETLRLAGSSQDLSAQEILRQELAGLTEELKAEIPNFSTNSAHQIALGTLSDWLMRCPLKLPPHSHGT